LRRFNEMKTRFDPTVFCNEGKSYCGVNTKFLAAAPLFPNARPA
jgi:hypothetical protein